jgi:hypothetical protein
MTSSAKIEANHMNSLHSTGPKSAEGKQKVSRNVFRHGLSDQEIIVEDGERELFEEFEAALIKDIAPEGALETTLFNQLLHAAWNLRRARIMEAALSRTGDPLADEELARKLERLARHQARLERSFQRALRVIKSLQTNAVFKTVYEQSTKSVLPPLADAREVAKQSHKLSAEALYVEVFHKMELQDNAMIAAARVERVGCEAESEAEAA